MRKLIKVIVITTMLLMSVSCSNKNVLDNTAKNIKNGTNNTTSKTALPIKNEVEKPTNKDLYLGNSPANIANGGLIAKQGDSLIYINSSDGLKLYKMKIDGSYNVKITDYPIPVGINIAGDWIYFLQSNSSIYRIKLSKPNKPEKVSDNKIFSFIIVNDWIYSVEFKSENGEHVQELYRMKLDGTNKTKLYESRIFIMIGIENDWMYFNRDGGTYKIKLDGTKETKVLEQTSFVLSNGYLFTRNKSKNTENGIYRFKTDGTFVNKVYSGDFDGFINISGDWILFKEESTNKLYKMNMNGEKKIILANDCNGSINTVEDWILYFSTSKNILGIPELRIINMDGSVRLY